MSQSPFGLAHRAHSNCREFARMDERERKYRALQANLQAMGHVAVAFSGGVDSTLLLRVAHDVLGANAIAITLHTSMIPDEELEACAQYCAVNGIEHIVVDYNVFEIPGFRENPPDRCYICKRGLFSAMFEAAGQRYKLVEGSNVDDLDDYRPGNRAIRELGVESPLLAAGLSKADIRALSAQLGLATASKPSAACLASRFAYGDIITDEGLHMVAQAEAFLRQEGFMHVRVRIHGNLARIEVEPARVSELAMPPVQNRVVARLKELGFTYVTLDLSGYRMGSMNEALDL